MTEPHWQDVAVTGLREDEATDDVTTALLGDAVHRPGVGRVRAETRCVAAGHPLAEAVFERLDPSSVVTAEVPDGEWVEDGALWLSVEATVGALLSGERVALNYLQRLAAVATTTRRAVEGTAGTSCVVTDTRKTTPGLRAIERYAVRMGGGTNHRWSLSDQVLWKDNHWAILASTGERLTDALARLGKEVPVQVEVESEAQLEEALEAGVTLLLLDNLPPDTIRAWRRRVGDQVVLEASGGIRPEDVGVFAAAGVDRVSVGALTHSADPVSLTFEVEVV